MAKLFHLEAIHKGRPADSGGARFAEFGRSIVIRVWFYCFIRTQGEGGLEILVLAGRPLWMVPNRTCNRRVESTRTSESTKNLHRKEIRHNNNNVNSNRTVQYGRWGWRFDIADIREDAKFIPTNIEDDNESTDDSEDDESDMD